jgi:ParB family chromosome partitioning protein
MRIKNLEGVTTRDSFNIPVALIHVAEGYNLGGREFDLVRPADVELMESIRANGVKVPLTVRAEGDKVFVVAGHRRLGACRMLAELGHDVGTVPCVAEGRGVTEKDRHYDLILSNSALSPTGVQIGDWAIRARAMGDDDKEISRRTGFTVRYIQGMVSLAGAGPEIRAMIDAGQVSTTLAYETIQAEGLTAAMATLTKALQDAIAAGKSRVTDKVIRASKVRTHVRATGGTADDVDSNGMGYTAHKTKIYLGTDLQAECQTARIATAMVKLLNAALV